MEGEIQDPVKVRVMMGPNIKYEGEMSRERLKFGLGLAQLIADLNGVRLGEQMPGYPQGVTGEHIAAIFGLTGLERQSGYIWVGRRG